MGDPVYTAYPEACTPEAPSTTAQDSGTWASDSFQEPQSAGGEGQALLGRERKPASEMWRAAASS